MNHKNDDWITMTTPPSTNSKAGSIGSVGQQVHTKTRRPAKSVSPKRSTNRGQQKYQQQQRDVTPKRKNSSSSSSSKTNTSTSDNSKSRSRKKKTLSLSPIRSRRNTSNHNSSSNNKKTAADVLLLSSLKINQRWKSPSTPSPSPRSAGTAARTNSNTSRRNVEVDSNTITSRNTSTSNSKTTHTNNHNYHSTNPAPVRFPPDMQEPGIEVIQRIVRSCGIVEEVPRECQQQVQTLIQEWQEHQHQYRYFPPHHKEATKKKKTTTGAWLPPKQRKQRQQQQEQDKQEEAQKREQQQPYVHDTQQLSDTTHIPYITIDGETTTDLDQAMYITYLPEGIAIGTDHDTGTGNGNDGVSCYWISYALADGAHYCPAYTPIFESALRQGKGTSWYVPGKAIPMLPHDLVATVMSLTPHAPKRALVFDIYLDPKSGTVIKTFYKWSIIQSLWQGTYRQVAEYYTAIDTHKNTSKSNSINKQNTTAPATSSPAWLFEQPFKETLDLLRVVALKRIELANAGVDSPNPPNQDTGERGGTGIVIDETTGLLTFRTFASGKQRYVTEVYNEQISLMCNTEGAKVLAFLDELEEHSLAAAAKVRSLPAKFLSLSMRSRLTASASASLMSSSRRSIFSAGGASTTSSKIVHPIYRTQGPPREHQIQILEEVIIRTLKANGFDAVKWSWHRQSLRTTASGTTARVTAFASSVGEDNDSVSDNDTAVVDNKNETLACYLQRLRTYTDVLENEGSIHRLRRWEGVMSVIQRQAKVTNSAAHFTTNSSNARHHSLKLTHYARFSAPMRELVGCFLHKELWEARTGQFSNDQLSPERDVQLRGEVIRAAKKAKEIQKRLSGMVFLHMLNTIFYKELKLHLNKRKIYKGMMMGMDFSEQQKSRRCYVRLEDPSIEIKVYADDLDYHYNCRYGPAGGDPYDPRRGSTISIAPRPGSFASDVYDHTDPPAFHAGCRVTIRVGDYCQFYGQASRSRWIFIMKPEEMEHQQNLADVRLSLRRNSIIDRDHFFNCRTSITSLDSSAVEEASLLSDLTDRSESITEFDDNTVEELFSNDFIVNTKKQEEPRH